MFNICLTKNNFQNKNAYNQWQQIHMSERKTNKHVLAYFCIATGVVAGSVAMPLGMQAVQKSIPVPSTFFHKDLVMKIFLQP